MNRRDFLRVAAASFAARLIAPGQKAQQRRQDLDRLVKENEDLRERDELRERVARRLEQEKAELERENHELAFELWAWSMGYGTEADDRSISTGALLDRAMAREHYEYNPEMSRYTRRAIEDLPYKWMALLPPDVSWSGSGQEDGFWKYSLLIPVNRSEAYPMKEKGETDEQADSV